MKLAVLGVGLIGGSIGLAAREHVEDAEVVGFGRSPERLDDARERGAIDLAAGSLEEALEGAEACFCCAPVGALPDQVRAALAAAGADCLVTDVGSTKRRLVESLDDERFVGGHPIAGAETSGVEHARADLFQGAVWYLTPHERSSGLLYERLHRLVVSFGARPVAIDAHTHDRLLASVSHLPHVLANVLVSQAARTLAGGDQPLPRVGPSFRDATRVAGASSAIWTDIYMANREAIAEEIDETVERLREVSDALPDGRPRGRRGLERAGAGGSPPAAGGGSGRRAGSRASAHGAQPPGYRRAGGTRARHLGREHRGPRPGAGARHALGSDDALDRRRRPGRPCPRADSRAGLPRRVSRFEPSGPLRGEFAPPPDKSISHRAALFGAMSDVPVAVRNYLDSADTRSTIEALLKLGAGVQEGTEPGSLTVRGVGLHAPLEATGGRLDVGNSGTLLRLLPGWLAGQPGGVWTLDGDESIRRRPVDRVVEPLG